MSLKCHCLYLILWIVTNEVTCPAVPSPNKITSRPVFMPDTFTGANREWSDWIGQFEMAAEVNGWDDSLKLKFLSLLLSGRARDIYCGLSTESRSRYVILKASLGRCLEPCDSDDWNRILKCGSGVYLNAKIGGSDVHLLLDTGVQASIIPKHVWLRLTEGGCPLFDYVGEASAANGGTMYILGHWQTICQFGSLALINEFLVADISTPDILLGMDFLLKYGVIIDLREQCCSVMGKQFPLISTGDALSRMSWRCPEGGLWILF
uniref:Peptidase A2 domain-containing protein n=1 Tax=Sinocyclocheilus rhinocerous TaxID=307959 RepID=A0A673M4B7_9TELE